ncbi:MAG: hypothetical protein ACREDR_42640, partial [Blastocatellia bacterium]
ILELDLPEIQGLRFIENVRSLDVLKMTPLIVQAALAGGVTRGQCLSAGANLVIEKHVGVVPIVTAVNELLS